MKTLAFCRILWYNVYMENREMQTSNTEEMVTISRAEYERLQQENAQLEAKSAKLEETGAYQWPRSESEVEVVQKEAVWPFFGTGGADGHGATEPDLQ